MKTNYIQITLKKAQANFHELCDAAASHRDVIIIKRPKGANVALVAADELSGLIETLYLLGSQKNAARLFAALRRAQRR